MTTISISCQKSTKIFHCFWSQFWSFVSFQNLSILSRPSNMLAYNISCEGVSHLVVSNSLRPHGLQPSRYPRPWNSPGNNTEVGCHFLLQGTKAGSLALQADSLPSESPEKPQEYWSEQPFPSPQYLPHPGVESGSPTLQADSLLSESPGSPILSHRIPL